MRDEQVPLYGGQAVLEGVMIRGPRAAALAVRTRDGIVVLRRSLRPPGERGRIWSWPLLRGCAVLWEALSLGVDALLQSASLVAESEDRPLGRGEKAFTVVLAVLLAVGLFILLPTLVVRALEPFVAGSTARNLLEGGVRLSVLLAYVTAVGWMPDVRRVLMYHGAEHKVIHAFEAGDRLTVERVRRYPRLHPRCGTSFLLQVVLVSTLLFGLFGWPVWWQRVALRLALLPLVAGVAYEIIRASGRSTSGLWRTLAAPGLWLQRFTTREPDDEQIEVAIRALEATREAEAEPSPCSSGWSGWHVATSS